MEDKWIKLDNAANLFPAAAERSDTKVFRFSCELSETVDCEILEAAVAEASEVFDVFNYVLKKGLFWYYFEKSELKPIVREEYKPVCAQLYNPEKKELLYEVTYYKNRINLEMFHALSDGTGALKFLECIVNKYLSKAHEIPEPELDYDASNHEKEDDSFYRYYEDNKNAPKAKKVKRKKAYKFKSGRLPDDRISVITGHIDLQGALNEAHKRNTTLTGYLASNLLCAIAETMPRRLKGLPVVLSIPVNLRKYFPSSSARNFFAMVNIGYNFKKNPSDIQSVIESITAKLKKSLSEENLEEIIAKYSSMENNIFVRIAPLWLKNFCIKVVHKRGASEISGILSNIGKTSLPTEISPYVKAVDIFSSTKNLQICAVSYQNVLSISFTSPFYDCDIQKNFFRKLTDNGIKVEITSNADTF